MTTNSMKDINKTALSLALWMAAIVSIVAWRSNGDSMALCFTAGMPIGVFSFWLVLTLGRKVGEKESDKKRKVQKAMASAPVATPVQARMPYTPPVSAVPPQVSKTSSDSIVSTALEPESPLAPFDLANLNELDYLYSPSGGRARSTLASNNDTNPASPSAPEASIPNPSPVAIDLEMDFNE